MTKRMLIDATHEEETRVAVLDGDRLDEFDYESKFRKPLKGSIFLAKVTRVEPSLQAAFVNFGGNRHGFLPFSEIHPDYFRIPISDREALIAEQEEALKAEEDEEEALGSGDETDEDLSEESDDADEIEELGGEEAADDSGEDKREDSKGNKKELSDDSEDGENSGTEDSDSDEDEDEDDGNRRRGRGRYNRGRGKRGSRVRNAAHRSRRTESFGGDDVDDQSRSRFSLRRKYKIQEVIKRGQIMLVQVSKEERGNKGAAVTSYLSLPGRYCVLMPNSPRGGGVSRKIANYKDRTRIRDMIKEMEVPKGMSVIVRTAGLSRTKTEIKRDLDYLMRLWDNIRELTLQSSAPAMVYEEADLIKRAVRDLYTRDVDEVLVSGDEGYKNAKNFMKMMIPSHAKRVKQYKEGDIPLFHRYKAEAQITEIGEMQVTLPSGGYLIINPTEALVSIDVNSGKSTKERHIEETALKTNLEAATEVARQLRLRDLGGLVVIDFIDMEDRRNNGKVERRMRDSLSSDRARIQMGRISSFGLMELSRQRMNPSLTESQYELCNHCHGSGRIRTADATSIMVLRAIEDEGIKGRAAQLIVHVPNAVALYILNNKREDVARIEARYNFTILIRVDDELSGSAFRVEVARPSKSHKSEDKTEKADKADKEEGDETADQKISGGERDEDGDNNKRRRRGRRGGRRRNSRNRDQDQSEDSGSYNRERVRSDKEDETAKTDSNQKQAESDSSMKEDEKKPRSKSSTEQKKKTEEDEGGPVEKTPSKEVSEEVKKKAPAKRGRSSSSDTDKAEKSSVDKEEKAGTEKKAVPSTKKKVAASNDDQDRARDYETVNKTPEKKKKGWWSKATEKIGSS